MLGDGSDEFHLHDGSERCCGCGFGANNAADAGDVGQDVDPAVLVLHLFQQADKGDGVGEVAVPVARLRTVPPHLIDEGLEPLLTPRHPDHHGPR